MSINYDAGLVGVNTPSAITGVIADRPAATDVSEGTFFISTDTQEIFSAKAGAWISVSGGGGGSQNLDQVLGVGNTATNKEINLTSTTTNTTSKSRANDLLLQTVSGLAKFFVEIINAANRVFLEIKSGYNTSNNYYIDIDTNKNEIQQNSIYENQSLARITNAVNSTTADGSAQTEWETSNSKWNILNDQINKLIYLEGYDYGVFQTRFKLDLIFGNWPYIMPTIISEIRVSPGTDARRVNFYLGNFDQLGQTTTDIFLPSWSGIIANVNERIVATGIDLTVGNYPIDKYGVYQIANGDNTNVLDFTNFIAFGTDGECVTLIIDSTPVKFNPSQVVGKTNINSKGMVKCVLWNNNVYN